MTRFLLLLAMAAAAPAQGNADAQVLRLLEEDYEAQMRRWPTWATERGDRRYDDRLADLGDEARAAWIADAGARQDALAAIDRSALSPARRMDLKLLEYELALRIEAEKFPPAQLAVSQLDGPQVSLPQLPSRATFTTRAQLEAYVARLEQVPRYLDQTIVNLKAGLAAGRTPPRVTMGAAAAQALGNGTEAQARDPSLHPMYPPFPKGWGRDALVDRADRAIREGVVPAFRRLGEFLRDEYVPHCRESIAASDSVDGLAWYRSQLQYHTTLDRDPQWIHETGLKEVARIRGEMLKAIARTDFPRKDELSGDALFQAFAAWLRTDPRFYYDQPEELLAGYRDIAKRVDAFLPRLFGRLPRLTYGVKEMPAFLAPVSPTAYYYSGSLENGVPGYFVANTFRLDQRPRYEMIPLTLHEAVPGHHLQIALAQEMEDVPRWRTLLGYTAFVEGWALYAERLGLEMEGLYADPYDDFGRLSYEMWRALRLVVDTGIHAQGWSREKAVSYMLGNSALTRQNVEREVDRYIAWPGQATAYKVGEMLILLLRKQAEQQLGERFDVRAFHDMLLAEGAIPLPLLMARAGNWIAEQAK